jgi:carnitine-CoA ligase
MRRGERDCGECLVDLDQVQVGDVEGAVAVQRVADRVGGLEQKRRVRPGDGSVAPRTLTTGYFREDEATAAAWRNGWLHTGDAMRRSAESDFYFVDRYNDCIRRKRENISSFEVAGYVMEHPSVAEAAAVGVPSEDGEQEIKVFVVPREPVDLAALGDWLAERTPRFMTPRYLEAVPSLPRTQATGRVQKSSLRSRAAGPTLWDRSA